MTKLADDSRIQNLHVEVQEWEEQLHFLHRVAPGPADRSYGIQVARLAGLPKAVIQKAQRLLAQAPEAPPRAPMPSQPALPLFEVEPDALRAELEALDLSRMTPLEALNWLAMKQAGR
ncbi:MAG: mismatch repair protein MutS [Holophagaceae bacterium]|nr:mismatch repair protein MutS [Holophagaceae bacterium]